MDTQTIDTQTIDTQTQRPPRPLLGLLAGLAVVVLGGFHLGGLPAHDRTGPQVRADVALKLYVFDCGEVTIRDLSVLSPGVDEGVAMELADPCYLVVHPRGTLFWDAGLPDRLVDVPGGVDAMGGVFHLAVSRTLSAQLEETGVDPAQIDFLALSHLHSDHTGNVSYFPQATWLVQATEHDLAFSAEAATYGFDPDAYASLRNNPVKRLQGDYDVFGDSSVVIVATPGHSPGHQALLVRLPNTGPVVLSGDVYHFEKNREHYRIPSFNASREASVQSFAKLDRLLRETGAQLWIQHDGEQHEGRRLAPAFYD